MALHSLYSRRPKEKPSNQSQKQPLSLSTSQSTRLKRIRSPPQGYRSSLLSPHHLSICTHTTRSKSPHRHIPTSPNLAKPSKSGNTSFRLMRAPPSLLPNKKRPGAVFSAPGHTPPTSAAAGGLLGFYLARLVQTDAGDGGCAPRREGHVGVAGRRVLPLVHRLGGGARQLLARSAHNPLHLGQAQARAQALVFPLGNQVFRTASTQCDQRAPAPAQVNGSCDSFAALDRCRLSSIRPTRPIRRAPRTRLAAYWSPLRSATVSSNPESAAR